ncbi:MAG: HupE/UreJ family protein [Pseudomonadota bacterium]
MRGLSMMSVTRLVFLRWVSTLWLLMLAPMAAAHEVVPSITDVTVEGGTLSMALRTNIEAQLSGIDLDVVADTDEAENAADYDALRALDGAAVAARAEELVQTWNALPLITVDGAAVALVLETVEIPEVSDFELPRVSEMLMRGAVPEGATTLTVTWPDGAGDLVVRQQGVEEPFTGLVAGGANTGPIAIAGGDAVTGWAAFVDYIPVGFDHILPKGLDHILFVLGLFFLSVRLGPLLWQVSAFTLAHTVTLALGALGLVTISPAIVEPLIAASIVFVAVENIFARGLNRWRPVIVFGFGLLHGLGFASVLGEYGLPDGAFLPALIGFNIGVELGQLTVIALMALALLLGTLAARAARLTGGEQVVEEYAIMFRAWSMTGSVIIALVAIWWVIERVFL